MAAVACSLTREELANLASEIATSAQAIKRLASMLDASNDLHDRGALAASIGALASSAGSMADFLKTAHGGPAVVGGAADWFKPV